MVTKERIAAILARCEAATIGPWVVNMDADVEAVNVLRLITEDDPCNGLIAYRVAGFPYSAEGSRQRLDAAFISEARTDVPELAHEVLRLMDESDTVRRLAISEASESVQKLLEHMHELRVLTELKLNEARLEIGELKEALNLANASAANWEECWSAEIGHANRYKSERDEALAELERLKKELKEREMNDLARHHFSRHATKISLYGVAQTTDGTENGPISGWARDGEGRESFQTVSEAMRLLAFIGWNGVVCSYPDGKHRMTRPTSAV